VIEDKSNHNTSNGCLPKLSLPFFGGLSDLRSTNINVKTKPKSWENELWVENSPSQYAASPEKRETLLWKKEIFEKMQTMAKAKEINSIFFIKFTKKLQQW
jgi:hypothetical protein